MFRRLQLTAFLCILLAAPLAQAQISTAVRSRDPVLGGGSELKKFRSAVVSDAAGERMAFRATVRDGSTSRQGIVRADASGNGTMIVEKDAATPSGSSYRNFLQPAINSAGDVAWFAFLADGRRGLFRTLLGNPLNSRTVAIDGSSAPVGAYTFSDFDAPELSDAGAVVFWARATDTMSSNLIEGIFVCEGGDGDCVTGGGTASVLAKTGDLVDGRELCEFARTIRIGSYGVAFLATTRTNCSSPSGSLDGVFRVDFAGSNGIETIALVGDPTDIGGATYQRFRDTPSIENNGIVAFRADTSSESTSEAIFLCKPSSGCPGSSLPVSVVDKGQIQSGSELRRFSGPQISNNGDIVFLARPRGGTAVGPTLYVRRSGGLLERIVTGDQPLDDVGGAVFRRVGTHHVSAGGTLSFRSTVTGPTWRVALFLWQP